MSRRALSRIVLALFVGLPTIFLFQNCGGGVNGARLVYNPRGGGLGFTERPYSVSGALTAGGSVDAVNFEFADSDKRVIFLADKDTNDLIELYAANRDGTDSLKLSKGGFVTDFKVSGSKVFFLEETANLASLYMTDAAGGTPVNLSGPLVTGGQVDSFQITPDGLHAVFLADKDTLGVNELYTVATSGTPAPTKLHPALAAGQKVNDFKALDLRVVFTGNINSPSRQEMYAIDHDGNNGHMISPTGAPAGSQIGKIDSNADASVVIYIGDMTTPGKMQLYRTAWDGNSQMALSPDTAPGNVEDFALSQTSPYVILTGALSSLGQTEIYARDLTSLAAPVKLNRPLVAGGDVTRFQLFDQMIMVGGGVILQPAVVFLADAEADDRFDLYFTRTFYIAMAERMNGAMNPAGDVFDFAISGDGARLAYVADQDVDGHYELFTKPLDSTPAVKAASGAGEQDVLPPLSFAPDGEHVFFSGDLDQAKQRQLYVTGDGETAKRISYATTNESHIYALKFSGDGKWVLFSGDLNKTGRDELYLSPVP